APTTAALARLTRLPPDRADVLLRKIADAGSLTAQRALIADAAAGTMGDGDAPRAVLFAHPLAISSAARRRFNIGPVTPSAGAGPAFALSLDPAEWDRSTAMNAPGQSGSA